jgi:putative ABC transport system ATP-binding protein
MVNSGTTLATVTNLSYRYQADAPDVLRNISLTLSEGDIVVLTGPSGSGKTTLLSLLGMIRRVESGQVCLFDTDIGAANEREIARLRLRVRIIFQKHYLLGSLTALQNVIAGVVADTTTEQEWNVMRAKDFLGIVGLAEHTAKWPSQLSVGQQQRVAVARALVALPDILLADEPTASLDRESARLVAERIQEAALTLHCGVIISTHDDRIMDIATRHVHIRDGRLAPAV